MLSSCFYTNIDDTRENPTIKLVLAITNFKCTAALENILEILILTYENNGFLAPPNN